MDESADAERATRLARNVVPGPFQLSVESGVAYKSLTNWPRKIARLTANALTRIWRRPDSTRQPAVTPREPIERILVIELWNIGDVILAMPFLASLRSRFPGAKVTLLARAFASDLLSESGLVDEFITADLDWGYGWHLDWPGRIRRVWRAGRELRRRRFDIIFSSRRHARERVLVSMSRARRRIGFALGWVDSSLTDAIATKGEDRHRIDEWMALLAPFGPKSTPPDARLRVDEQTRTWAREYLESRGVANDGVLIGIHPGASLPEKRWGLERFREIARAYATTPGFHVLAFAEPAPSNYGADIFETAGVIPAQVSLRALVALIERCDLLVCNDSGPMHIAGALSVPTVAMFGSGIEEWFRPLGEGHEFLRPLSDFDDVRLPSGYPAVRTPVGIEVSEVRAAIERAVRRLKTEGRPQNSLKASKRQER